MAEEDGNAHGGDSRSSGDTHACPVWVAGRCDGMVRADRKHYESGDAHADAAVDRWRQMFAEFDAREAN